MTVERTSPPAELSLLSGIPHNSVKKMMERGLEIRRSFSVVEQQDLGKEWPLSEIHRGWIEDLGDLFVSLDARKNADDPDASEVVARVGGELANNLWSAFVLAHRHDITLDTLLRTSRPFPLDDTMDPTNRLVVCVGTVGKSMRVIEGLRTMEAPKQVLTQSLAGAIVCVDRLAQQEGIDLEQAFYNKMEILEDKLKARSRNR